MKHFGDNLKLLRERKSLKQGSMEKELGVKQTTWNNYEKGKSYPKFEDLVKISKYFDIKLDDLIEENLEKITPNIIPNDIPINKTEKIEEIVNEPAVQYKKPAVRIPLLPYDAVAGRGLGVFEDVKIERHYDVHEFRQADFLIYVKGSSMYPKYSSGDILACRLIKERLFFQWNKTHVIYTDSQGVMVKRLCKSKKKNYIACHSDNKDYEMFEVPLKDIQDIAIVLGVIRLE